MTAALRLIATGEPEKRIYPHDPKVRGYVVRYRGASTECPGCGRTSWIVGRLSAECAFCSTALPIGEVR